MTNQDSILKCRDITLPINVHLVKAVVFPVVMHGCESWTTKKAEHIKNWCFWTMVLEKTLESPRRSNQSILKEIWTEASILWLPEMKSQLTGKDPHVGKDWRWEEKGTTEDEIVGWHHRFNGHEFEQALGAGDGQGRLACRSPWVAELDEIELLNWIKLTFIMIFFKVKSCVVKVLCAKGQFSCQSQRKAMPKNVWITIQLRSCHMLARLCSKSFKLGFSSTWMKNFQMYKLGFEEAEEPEVKYPISAGSQKKRIPEKHLLLHHWLH